MVPPPDRRRARASAALPSAPRDSRGIASAGALVDTLETAWTDFAKTGELAWPAWTAADPYMQLTDAPNPQMGLKATLCDFWDGLP